MPSLTRIRDIVLSVSPQSHTSKYPLSQSLSLSVSLYVCLSLPLSLFYTHTHEHIHTPPCSLLTPNVFLLIENPNVSFPCSAVLFPYNLMAMLSDISIQFSLVRSRTEPIQRINLKSYWVVRISVKRNLTLRGFLPPASW